MAHAWTAQIKGDTRLTKYCKVITLFIIVFTLAFSVSGCAKAGDTGDQIRITASLFPQYDFARAIGGDRVSVKLLLQPGSESHTFDPKPGDIAYIYDSTLFFYTGDSMEPWVSKLASSAPDTVRIVDLSSYVELQDDDHEDHDDGHDHADGDPHIWLDLSNAEKMLTAIENELCEIDPQGEELYRANAEVYRQRLTELDDKFFKAVQSAERNTLVFGGRFAYSYFLERYGLNWKTAYDSCSTQSEPGFARILEICDYINDNNIPVVYHEELCDPKVARSISKQTDAQLLEFTTCHNVTKEEFDSGVSFLDLMDRNLKNMIKGLTDIK